MSRSPPLVSSSWLGKGTRPWTQAPSSSRARLSGLWKGLNSRKRLATSFSGLRNCLIHPSAWKSNSPKFAKKPAKLIYLRNVLLLLGDKMQSLCGNGRCLREHRTATCPPLRSRVAPQSTLPAASQEHLAASSAGPEGRAQWYTEFLRPPAPVTWTGISTDGPGNQAALRRRGHPLKEDGGSLLPKRRTLGVGGDHLGIKHGVYRRDSPPRCVACHTKRSGRNGGRRPMGGGSLHALSSGLGFGWRILRGPSGASAYVCGRRRAFRLS